MVKKKEKKIKVKTKKEIEKNPEKNIATTLWKPFDVMDAMDRWFWDDPRTSLLHRFWGSIIPRDAWYDRWLEPEAKQTYIDIIDTGKEFKVIAEMPGVSKKDVEVSVTENNISICGETKTEIENENEGYIRRERSYSTLCRSMAFPQEVDPDKAKATLKDGILEIKVAKKTPTKGRNIPVK